MASAVVAVEPGSAAAAHTADVAQHQIAYQSQQMLELSSRQELLTDQWLTVLKDIASTGSSVHPWPSLLHVLRVRLLHVVRSVLMQDELRLEGECREAHARSIKLGLQDGEARLAYMCALLDDFTQAPFTLQRLAEILLFPTRHFSTGFKLMNALQKVLEVTSTVPPLPLHRRALNHDHWVYSVAAYAPLPDAVHPRPAYTASQASSVTSPGVTAPPVNAIVPAPTATAAVATGEAGHFPRPASSMLPTAVTTAEEAALDGSPTLRSRRVLLGDDEEDSRVLAGVMRTSKRPRMESPPTLPRSDSPNGLPLPGALEPYLAFPSAGSDSSPPFSRIHNAASMLMPGVSRSPELTETTGYSDMLLLHMTDDLMHARGRDEMHPPPLSAAAAVAWDTTASYSLAAAAVMEAPLLASGTDARDSGGDGGWGGEASSRHPISDSGSATAGRTAAEAYTAVAEAAAAVLRAPDVPPAPAARARSPDREEQPGKASSLQLLHEYDDED